MCERDGYIQGHQSEAFPPVLCGGPKTLSIIVPAYNEAESIALTINGIEGALQGCEAKFEIIVVDDGSGDGTYREALLAAEGSPNVRVVSYADNCGKGHALRHGFLFARGDMILFLDADSDLPPTQIPRFLDLMAETEADIVIGSKSHPLSDVKYPFARRLYSRGYSLLVKVLFGLSVGDTQTGIKLFRRNVLEKVLPKVVVKRYAVDLELLVNAGRLGYRIVEAPVVVNYQFRSRINPRDIWCIFLDTMGIFYRARIVHSYDRE